MYYPEIKADFDRDIATHEIKIVMDEGLNRHIIFSRPNSNDYRFDLITYKGGLLFRGDMGVLVFERLNDMFEFFRDKRINTGYWAEKLVAVDPRGYESWSWDKFKAAVKHDLDNHCETMHDQEKITSLREEVDDELHECEEDEYSSVQMIRNFDHEGFSFVDFWEHDLKDYTFHYVWACFAIVWAIEQYDKHKSTEPKGQ